MDEGSQTIITIILICFGLAILIVFFFLARYLIKYFREESVRSYTKMLDSLEKNESLLAKFSYTQSEWDYIFLQEFNETMITSFIESKWTYRRQNKRAPERQGKIYFFQKKIIITNGPEYKMFRFNEFNSLGFGCYLMSLEFQSEPQKILEMKIKIIAGIPSATSFGIRGIEESDDTYNILIPATGMREIDKIIKTYKESISAEAFYQNSPNYSEGLKLN